MGSLWLHDFPAEAAARDLNIKLYPGWELRSRSSGGFDGIWGVCMHHTASPPSTNPQDPANRMYHMWQSADTRPIGNFYLDRNGVATLGAAGAANTQGAGGPMVTSQGTVGLDAGNRYYIAIEAANNGIGEIWSDAQIAGYLKLVAVLCDVYDLDPVQDVIFHQTWAPTRKIDPAGPTPLIPSWGGTAGAKTWNLSNVRQSVVNYNLPPSDMSKLQVTNPVRILDTRPDTGGVSHNPHKGALSGTLDVKPHVFTPVGVSGVILTLTAVGITPGFFTLWDGIGGPPLGSNLNTGPGQVGNNMAWVPVRGDGSFTVYSPSANHLIVDQVGWYFT